MNTFEQLLLTYPSAPWDWRLVSMKVSFQFILSNSILPWVPLYVSKNSNITERDIKEHPEYPWIYEGLCSNPNLSFDFLNEIIIKQEAVHRVDWDLLSANPSITMLDVINNPTYNWNVRYLSANPNLTSNFILNEGSKFDWFVPFVSSNSGITTRDILKSTLRSVFDWDYRNLSANVNLPIVYVNDNLDQPWNYHSISVNASLMDIQMFHQIKWEPVGLSMNRNITFEYVKANPNINWHVYALLSNVPFQTIMSNYEWFANKLNEPLEPYLCLNPTITPTWIARNRLSIDWKKLSYNALK